MKIVVTHASPDWDAIGSVWLLKKYLEGWRDAKVEFVPAGERLTGTKAGDEAIERLGDDEIIHVDTGLGPLDHHQTPDRSICGMSRTWDFVRSKFLNKGKKLSSEHEEAIDRIVRIVVEIDHFREVFWDKPAADYHEFSLLGLLEGLKFLKPGDDQYYVEFGMEALSAMVANFENRIWAEKEIEKGIKFETKYGTGMGFETVNDGVLKLAQKMDFRVVVRKDPRKGYARIKALPEQEDGEKGADLTLAYEMLRKIDPDATWFLHVSKKMLLNGTPKNPKMRPTKLSLDDIIKVLEKL